MAQKAFLCHSHRDAHFALGMAAYLKRHLDDVFCFEERQSPDASFVTALNRALAQSTVFVIVVGDEVSEWQIREANDAYRDRGRSFFTVLLRDAAGRPSSIPDEIQHLKGYVVIEPAGADQASIQDAAAKIVIGLGIPWRFDDLPLDPHLFSYEKDVIGFYIRKAQLDYEPPCSDEENDEKEEIRRKILHGCPPEWPVVVKWSDALNPNRLSSDEIGICRDESASVLTTSLLNRDTMPSGGPKKAVLPQLNFPEAGPRQSLYFPRGRQLTVAILVSGGIAPGINAVIDGIVQRQWLYAERHGYSSADGLTVLGLLNGFRAFADMRKNYVLLAASPRNPVGAGNRLETSNHVNEGGSILGTSRVNDLLDLDRREYELTDIVSQLRNVDILYVIGGDGSMKAAHAIWNRAQAPDLHRKRGAPLSVVAIPKTMDNDILWVWQSFGFLSAVEKAREVIEQLNTEVISNPRLCIAQLFGSDSGFVVSHAVLASGTGHCDLALIPEVEFRMDCIAEYLTRKIAGRNKPLPYALVVLAETAIPKDAMRYAGEEGSKPEIDIGLSPKEKEAIREFAALRDRKRSIQGQTNDHLRTAGLKIVSQGLKTLLPVQNVLDGAHDLTDWSKLRVFTNEPRHLLRAIPPSCTDIISGHRLGTLAVDNAMAGYTDFMISQWLTEYVLVPLKLVVLGRKRIPQTGIFWKSVLAKTGQPAVLT